VWSTVWEVLDHLGVDFPARLSAMDAVLHVLSYLLWRHPCHANAIVLEVKIELGLNPDKGKDDLEVVKLDELGRWSVLRGGCVKKRTSHQGRQMVRPREVHPDGHGGGGGTHDYTDGKSSRRQGV